MSDSHFEFQQVGFINAGLYVASLTKIWHFYGFFFFFWWDGGKPEVKGDNMQMGRWLCLKLFKNLVVYKWMRM